MIRTQINLSKKNYNWLKIQAQKKDDSMSEVIRDLIDKEQKPENIFSKIIKLIFS